MPSSLDPDYDSGMARIGGLGHDVLDSMDLVGEEPAVEEDEVAEGYVLEEEDEELEKQEEEEEEEDVDEDEDEDEDEGTGSRAAWAGTRTSKIQVANCQRKIC